MQRIGPTRTAIYPNLVPVIAILVGALVFEERMSAFQLAGALLVFVGAYVTRRR